MHIRISLPLPRKPLTIEIDHGVMGFLAQYARRSQRLRVEHSLYKRATALRNMLLAGKLPENLRVIGHTQHESMLANGELSRPTVVYRLQDDGKWARHATVITSGHGYEFFASAAFTADDGTLVLTDPVSGIGISVDHTGISLELYDTEVDEYKDSFGGSWTARHMQTCELLANLKRGENAHYEHDWV